MFQTYLRRGFLIGGLIMTVLFFPWHSTAAQAADCGSLKTQAEITACLGDDAKTADVLLNTLYQNLVRQLSAKDKTNLRDAQRAWIVYRDKECDFRTAPYAGGSVAPSLVSSCIAALTSQRIYDLRTQLQCKEGDLSCVPHKQAGAAKPAPTPAPKAAADMTKGTCLQAVGAEKAKLLVDRCLDMSGSSHPPCNVQNSCSMMIEEITQGCAQSGAAAPQYCKDYK